MEPSGRSGGYRIPSGRFLSGRFCRMGKRTEQAERENIPYFRQPRHQEPKAELHEILRAENNTGKDASRLSMLLPTQYDVGVDNNDFTPVSFAQVKAIMGKQIEQSRK